MWDLIQRWTVANRTVQFQDFKNTEKVLNVEGSTFFLLLSIYEVNEEEQGKSATLCSQSAWWRNRMVFGIYTLLLHEIEQHYTKNNLAQVSADKKGKCPEEVLKKKKRKKKKVSQRLVGWSS